MQAFKVILDGKEIDKVFYNDEKTTREEVKRSLVDHDGYDPNIKIVKEHKNMHKIGDSIALYAIESNYDKGAHLVVLTRETETDYWGYPLSNDKCPVLQWPKFAWKEVK